MGGDSSKLQHQMKQVDPESEENFIGLENFGNTCYMNSVIQALYWCRPFRDQLLKYAEAHPLPTTPVEPPSKGPGRRSGTGEYAGLPAGPGAAAAAGAASGGLLHHMCDLFQQLQNNRKRTGCIAPQRLVRRIRQRNEMFAGLQQQDAHEFLVYLLNDLSDTMRGQMKDAKDGAAPDGTPSEGTAAESDGGRVGGVQAVA
eukprot:Hpha_TRINITY_DN35828_c0_g1::TRINITY_DN35828_c0_g1_i1::g.84935::m.84935/K11842/USP12_46; ubiquitin carboxyl-terminal hydrolase 12/46